MMPAPQDSMARLKYATPGVGRTPVIITSTPADAIPAVSADSIIGPEILVSRPMITHLLDDFCVKMPTAWPVFMASSHVIG